MAQTFTTNMGLGRMRTYCVQVGSGLSRPVSGGTGARWPQATAWPCRQGRRVGVRHRAGLLTALTGTSGVRAGPAVITSGRAGDNP